MLIKQNRFPQNYMLYGLLISGLILGYGSATYAQGVTDNAVILGSVLPLGGDTLAYGVSLQRGLTAALEGEIVHGRQIEIRFANDFYDPGITRTEVNRLLDEGVFAFIGNFGTPTAVVALPLLAVTNTPAIGFYTGSDILTKSEGLIVNFRPRYSEEVAALHRQALKSGLTRRQFCVFAQNDSFGMSAVIGLANTLREEPDLVELADHLLSLASLPDGHMARNQNGPVGVYDRGTTRIREAYESLKLWEDMENTQCRFIVMAAVAEPALEFMDYARRQNKNWAYGLLSFTADLQIGRPIADRGLHEQLVISQVVPAHNSDLPIMELFRTRLPGADDPLTIEGFIVGRLFVELAQRAANFSRESFMAAAVGQRFDLGGLELDFTQNNQGSTTVFFQQINAEGRFIPISADQGFTTLFR